MRLLMKSRWWIWIAISIVVLVMGVCWLRKDAEGERLDLDKYMFQRLSQCSNTIDTAYANFERECSSSADANEFEKARSGVDFVCSPEGLCGWKVCATLAYKMAVDKINETNLTEQAIAPVLYEHIFCHLENAIRKKAEILAGFQECVQTEVESFSADCCLRMKQYSSGVGPFAAILDDDTAKKIDERIEAINKTIRDLASESAMVAGGTAISAMFAKSTYIAIKKCVVGVASKFLAKIVARNVTSATIAGGAAVADGPLPIGDIIGGALEIGCLVWTAYDICNVTETMPKELRSQLMSVIDELEADTKKYMLEQARQSATNAVNVCRENIADFAKESEE